MNRIVDQERSQEWLSQLERKLGQCVQEGKDDVIIDYRSVSHSFPGGSHQDHFDVPLIEWNQLKYWANNQGWNVLPAPEKNAPRSTKYPIHSVYST